MARLPRILIVINSLGGGGAERVLTTLLAASRDHAYTHDLALVLLDDERVAYPPPEWLRVVQLNARGSLLRSVTGLRRVVGTERPDVILSFLTRANLAAVLAAIGTPARVILSERVNNSTHLGAGLRARVSGAMIRLLYPRADRIIAVSQGVASDLADAFAVPRARIEAIANPVDVATIVRRAAEPAPPPVLGPYIIGVGRLTTLKNFALLIDAYAKSGLAQRLVILGEGPERGALERQIAAFELRDRVVLAGFVANPYALMSGADMFVSPSRGEGFPNALVEAMAIGLPVISANCPSGPSEILADSPRKEVAGLTRADYGILVPVDDVAATAEALRLMDAPDTRCHYAAAARARAAQYSLAAARDAYWRVIDRETERARSANEGQRGYRRQSPAHGDTRRHRH